ncbi:MAG: hypothetical protein INQ03_09380 [Candidatus Heimdallarchaeota archaeon]|nr:hypothetical protein [Candidatus Heimdallarchaeota archaeon]
MKIIGKIVFTSTFFIILTSLISTPAIEQLINLDSEDPEWVDRIPTGNPSTRFGHQMTYVPEEQAVYLFGGSTGGRSSVSGIKNDIWRYSITNNTWTDITPTSNPITARYMAEMVYLPTTNELLVFGGSNSGYQQLSETWVFSLSNYTWTQLSPSNPPLGRDQFEMTFDAENDRVLIFGGYYQASRLSDFWQYTRNNNSWIQIQYSNGPTGRNSHCMSLDPNNNLLLLYGGYNGQFLFDTWYYHFDNSSWTQISTANTPTQGANAEMEYNSNQNQFVLFGGLKTGSDYGITETWIYDLEIENWTQLNPLNPPTGRMRFDMTFIKERNSIIVFGGNYIDSTNLGDTLELQMKVFTCITVTETITQTETTTDTETITSISTQTQTETTTDTETIETTIDPVPFPISMVVFSVVGILIYRLRRNM